MTLIDHRGSGLHALETGKTSEKFKLRIHDIQLEDIDPNGDRYTVEAIELDETMVLGSLLVVTQERPQEGGPLADPTIERRGVIAGVVVRAGNGHLLGLPDLAPISDTTGVTYDDEGEEDGPMWQAGDRPWPSVAMFYEPGDVLLIDHTAKGRALKILGREGRIINQIDVLARVERNGKPVKLTRKDGTWVEAE